MTEVNLGGHARLWMIGSPQPGHDRAHPDLVSLATAHDVLGATGVVGIRMCERTDNGHSIRQAGQAGEGAAKRDARHAGGQFAVDAADLGRSRHLWIEGLDLAGASGQEQQDDRLVTNRVVRGRLR